MRTANNWFGRPLTLMHDAVGNRTQLDGCGRHRWYYAADAEGRVPAWGTTAERVQDAARR